jgi:aspartyl-tRNA(Asn)/glutamyl-tRNA(Gln) amidotransferase subunit A
MLQLRATLREAGAIVTEVTLPDLHRTQLLQRLISPPETVAAHPAVREHLSQVGRDVRRRFKTGERVSAVDYIDAQLRRRALGDEFERVLNSVDAVITPATGVTAVRLGATGVRVRGRWRTLRDVYMSFTVPFSLTGHPCVVLPVASDEHGLAIAAQVVTRRFEDGHALSIALGIELALGAAAKQNLDSRLTGI